MSDNIQVHILQRLDKIQEDVGHIRESQIRTEIDVKYHIKRTDILEDIVIEMKKQVGWLAAPVNMVRALLRWFKLIR